VYFPSQEGKDFGSSYKLAKVIVIIWRRITPAFKQLGQDFEAMSNKQLFSSGWQDIAVDRHHKQ
jgi:hypothetical protein